MNTVGVACVCACVGIRINQNPYNHENNKKVRPHTQNSPTRIKRAENSRELGDVDDAGDAEEGEPDEGDRREGERELGRADALDEEEEDEEGLFMCMFARAHARACVWRGWRGVVVCGERMCASACRERGRHAQMET